MKKPMKELHGINGSFFVRVNGRNERVRVADIQYVESSRNYCKIHLQGRVVTILIPLKMMEEILPAAQFVRIHRAFLISLDWLQAFDRCNVYGPDRTLPIGDHYRGELTRRVCMLEDVYLRFPLRNKREQKSSL
jgi:two-component system LytT family response regulator